MMMPQVVAGVCAGVVAVVAIMLILHQEYEDGLIGRAALIGIGLAALVRLIEIFPVLPDVGASSVGRVELVLLVSLAVFLVRHLCRFLRWRNKGDHDWRPARK